VGGVGVGQKTLTLALVAEVALAVF